MRIVALAAFACTLLVGSAQGRPLHVTVAVEKAGTGTGTIRSVPAFINCGRICIAAVPALDEGGATQIALRAVPAAGSVFTGWGGPCEGSGATCTIEPEFAAWIPVLFDRAASRTRFPLAVGRTGDGVVRGDAGGIDCGTACAALLQAGTAVMLTATPSPGAAFTGWRGACSGQGECRVTMTGARAVTASFSAGVGTTLGVGVGKAGSGTVRSTPGGVDCGPRCSLSLGLGQTVTLTAAEARGSRFVGWTGACEGSSRRCVLVLDGAAAAVALFNDRGDTAAPSVRALASSGRRGSSVRLRYRVSDDSGRSREDVTVYRGKTVLARVRSPLNAAEREVLYYFVSWRAPKRLAPGALRFCVRAADAAGNASRPSCASLRIR